MTLIFTSCFFTFCSVLTIKEQETLHMLWVGSKGKVSGRLLEVCHSTISLIKSTDSSQVPDLETPIWHSSSLALKKSWVPERQYAIILRFKFVFHSSTAAVAQLLLTQIRLFILLVVGMGSQLKGDGDDLSRVFQVILRQICLPGCFVVPVQIYLSSVTYWVRKVCLKTMERTWTSNFTTMALFCTDKAIHE